MITKPARAPARPDRTAGTRRRPSWHTACLGALALGLAACSSSSPAPGTTRAATSASGTATSSSPKATSTAPGIDTVGTSDPWIVYEGPIPGYDGQRAGNRGVRPDGSGDHWVTPGVPLPAQYNGWQVHPDWSPDGQRLAFAADDPRQDGQSVVTRDLWVSDVNGGHLDRVFDCELPCAEADDPAWSPDGQSLAFDVFDAKGDFNVNIRIVVLDLETHRLRTITRASGNDNITQPRWSPDGRTLAFEVQHVTDESLTGKVTATAIATVPVTDHAATATVITPWSMCASYPDWHPTHDLILFAIYGCPKLAGPFNLWTVRADGSHLTQVTHYPKGPGSRAIQPTFTPDGTHIIFTTTEGDDISTATMVEVALDGSGLTSATSSGPLFGTHPRLRPNVG